MKAIVCPRCNHKGKMEVTRTVGWVHSTCDKCHAQFSIPSLLYPDKPKEKV